MATAGLGRVGGYLEPLQGIHLRDITKKPWELQKLCIQDFKKCLNLIPKKHINPERRWDSPKLLRVLMHTDHPVVIGFTFARFPGAAHRCPRVTQGAVQHPDHPVWIHMARGSWETQLALPRQKWADDFHTSKLCLETNPQLWIQARTSRTWETMEEARRWWPASFFDQTAAAAHPETVRHQNQ